jgi:F-type H+-transporting ATPase subunit b
MMVVLELNIPTFIFVIINLTVLYLIMKKFLFKPVTEFMEKRAKSIRDDIDNAKRSKAEAEELKKAYEAHLKEAKRQCEKIINEARDRADKQYDAIIKQAKQEAQEIIGKAKDVVEKERVEMIKGIKNQVASMALAAATKLVETNMDTESNRKLVEKFIDETGVA